MKKLLILLFISLITITGCSSIKVSNKTRMDDNEKFSVTIIPETFNKTIFYTRKIGDVVNVELDVLAKYVENILNKKNDKKEITFDLLKENGFY